MQKLLHKGFPLSYDEPGWDGTPTDILRTIIFQNDPFLVTRPGIVEMRNLDVPREELRMQTGFYCMNPDEEARIHQIWKDMYLKGMNESDAIAISTSQSDFMLPAFKRQNVSEDFIIPYSEDQRFYLDALRTLTQQGKTVLAAFPFAETARHQLSRFKDVYPNVDFDISRIRTYQTQITTPGNEPASTWLETFESMREDIAAIPFDVAFLGCGSYGIPLSLAIRKLGRSALYVGGRLQMCFGIKGSRWTGTYPPDAAFREMFWNDAWIYPSPEEHPENHASVGKGGCYWEATPREG